MLHRDVWKNLIEKAATLGVRALPGLFVIGLVVVARSTGMMQVLEWAALDSLLRLRPAEPKDERIVIISIDEAEIRKMGGYPIPDREIVDLVQSLQAHKPAVIGLNILRESPVQSGNVNLFTALGQRKNLIGVEKVLAEQIFPPSGFPSAQVGFSDIYVDGDNHLRRMILGTPNPVNPENKKEYKFSLAIRLAETYLTPKGYTLKNGIRDPVAMRFGDTEFPRFLPNTGGYVGTDAGGVQILLNFRSGREPFRMVSLTEFKAGRFDPEWLRDRIVIIGITNPKLRTPIPTNAVRSSKSLSGRVHGVEIQAHAVSQIINAVLDKRPLLKTWSDEWEFFWIIGWGVLGIILCQHSQLRSRWKLVSVGVTCIILLGFCHWLMILGWWLPVTPTLMVLLLTGIEYAALYTLYGHERGLKVQIEERQRTIERTFDIIHNGPLQTLANLSRSIRDEDLSRDKLLSELEQLDLEIRDIGEYLKRETLTYEESLYLSNELKLDLKPPIHQLFYEVYSNTLERDFPGFKALKKKVRSFDPIDDYYLNAEYKRRLCSFLEEALCNVGKHADGVTYLSVTGKHSEGRYSLRVEDNGSGICSPYEGVGTKQARRLAAQLQGEFKRESLSPQGTLCELTWFLAQVQP